MSQPEQGPALAAEPDPPGPPDRTRLATLSFHISAVLYVVLAGLLAIVPLGWDEATTEEYALRSGVTWFLALLSLGLAILVWFVIRGLRRHRRWAWKTGIVLFVLYLPSWFLPIGAVGLFGLLSKGTRERFALPRSDTVRRTRGPGRPPGQSS